MNNLSKDKKKEGFVFGDDEKILGLIRINTMSYWSLICCCLIIGIALGAFMFYNVQKTQQYQGAFNQ